MNDLIQWVNARYAELVATGLTGYVVARDIVKAVITRKVSSNFDDLSTNLTKVVDVSSKAQAVRDKVVFEEVNGLKEQLLEQQKDSLRKDMQINQLTDMNISLMSIANIPLVAKEDFSKSISHFDMVNKNVKLSLDKSIEAQKKSLEHQAQDKIDALDKLKEMS